MTTMEDLIEEDDEEAQVWEEGIALPPAVLSTSALSQKKNHDDRAGVVVKDGSVVAAEETRRTTAEGDEEDDEEEVVENGVNDDVDKNSPSFATMPLSERWVSLLLAMLHPVSRKRPTIREVRWFVTTFLTNPASSSSSTSTAEPKQ